MKTTAFARLDRQHPRPWRRTVELVELDLPGDSLTRYIVSVRQGAVKAGAMMDAQESTLTASPCTFAEAQRRALDFIQRRLGAGDVLVQHEGFAGLTPPPAAISAATATVPDPLDLPPTHITMLVARFQRDHWKLQSPARQARSVWRVAECAEAGVTNGAQRALVVLVPRLLELLETSDDLLDYCIAVAVARLGDRGAAPAMRSLAQRGRGAATRRAAHQAWLLLQPHDAQIAHAATLLPQWQDELHASETAAPNIEALETRLSQSNCTWVDLLTDWYDVALTQAAARVNLLALLRVLPMRPGFFKALRYVYKAAEIRRDAAVIGLLHARLENIHAYFNNLGQKGERGFQHPDTHRWIKTPVKRELSDANSRLAYTSRTRDYLRLRAWRTLRRLAELNHAHASELAVQLLLGLVDDELPAATEETRWQVNVRNTLVTRYYARAANWLLVPKLLLARHAGVQVSARGTRWWTTQPLDSGTPLPTRTDGLPALWDANPHALLSLALHSRSELVHAVVARALLDHAEFLAAQPEWVLAALLKTAYAPTARVGFMTVKALVLQNERSGDQVPWLILLAQSADEAAREFAFVHIASDPARFAAHVNLVSALLLSEHVRVRNQGHGLALIAESTELLAELQSALIAVDAEHPGLSEGTALIQGLITGQLKNAAAQAEVEPLLCLLDHPATAVVNLAVTWLLLHGHGAALVPAPVLARLFNATSDDRRACGVRLLSAWSEEVLCTQIALLSDLAVHPHAGIRAAVAPLLRRVAAVDATFATSLGQRLHAALFASETGEGVHADALDWLTTFLIGHAPARDASSAWRALQARSRGAQTYGAWVLAALAPEEFSLKQQATLARHADVTVRAWSMQALDRSLPATPSPEQAAQLLPLADAAFDDVVAYAHRLFGERLSDASLSVELLIAWIDHPQAWLQTLGRMRLVRRMHAEEASLCLTRLSQHPSTRVQLFVTQWLLELPRDDVSQLTSRLRELKPYFVTVLSQVNRSRAAKTRITEFLRGLTAAPETAAVVAEIFARQVVTSSLTDKPQFIAGLRDIAARHPHIELPCIAWRLPGSRPCEALR